MWPKVYISSSKRACEYDTSSGGCAEQTDLIPLSFKQFAAVNHMLVMLLAGVSLLHELNKVPCSRSNIIQASTTTHIFVTATTCFNDTRI